MASPQEQKDKFEDGFQQIIDAAPVNVGSKWNGRYNWMDPPGKTASQPKVETVVNKLSPELKAQLKREFAPEILRLSQLLRRDLTHWSKG